MLAARRMTIVTHSKTEKKAHTQRTHKKYFKLHTDPCFLVVT